MISSLCSFSQQSEDNPTEEALQWLSRSIRHPLVHPGRPSSRLLPPEQQRQRGGCRHQLHRTPGRQLDDPPASPRLAAQTQHPGSERQPPHPGYPQRPHRDAQRPQDVPQPGLDRPGQQRGHLHHASAAAGRSASALQPEEQLADDLRVHRGSALLLPPGDVYRGAQPLRGGRGGGGRGGGWRGRHGEQVCAGAVGLRREAAVQRLHPPLLREVMGPSLCEALSTVVEMSSHDTLLLPSPFRPHTTSPVTLWGTRETAAHIVNFSSRHG